MVMRLSKSWFFTQYLFVLDEVLIKHVKQIPSSLSFGKKVQRLHTFSEKDDCEIRSRFPSGKSLVCLCGQNHEVKACSVTANLL